MKTNTQLVKESKRRAIEAGGKRLDLMLRPHPYQIAQAMVSQGLVSSITEACNTALLRMVQEDTQ